MFAFTFAPKLFAFADWDLHIEALLQLPPARRRTKRALFAQCGSRSATASNFGAAVNATFGGRGASEPRAAA